MIVSNFFKQLSSISGLPLIVLLCAILIFVSACTFGILILIRVRNIKKVLKNLDDRLDLLGHQLGWQSWEFEKFEINKHSKRSPFKFKNRDIQANQPNKNPTEPAQKGGDDEQRINTKIKTKIHELLKKSGKPTTYHDLTKNLSKVYPGYNYDFFLKEVEDLQKEGKVEVQLIAGKLYFQVKTI
jgi:hypothetical protein